jgi:acetyl esterase/lipase
MLRNLPLLLAIFPFMSLGPNAVAQPGPSYPAVPAGVSFDAVLELPVGTPTSRHPYGEAPSQFAELWLPANTSADIPVVAFIHGGCWLSQYSIEHSHALATALTHSGYAVWNIEYRRVGETGGGWPGSLEDIQAAIALLYTLNPPAVDLDSLVLVGHSAGGHLALLATDSVPAIGLAPIIDIADYANGEGSCNAAAAQFMGALPTENPAAYRAATPVLQNKDRVLMGTQDHIVPAQDQYLPAAYSHWPNAGHFDWIHPGTPAWQEFLGQLRSLQP